MKRIALLLAVSALATPALAADIIYNDPIAAPMAYDTGYTWTGFYVGAQAGAALSRDSGLFSSAGSSFAGGSKDGEAGVVLGLHAGYDHQIDNFIVGAIADINYVDANSYANFTQFGQEFGSKQDIDFLGTLRAKAGLTSDRFAVFATGGLAFAKVSNDLIGNSSVTSGGTSYNVSLEEDTKDFGYALGAGLDYLVAQNVSVGLEYLYTDLGKSDTKVKYTPAGSSIATESLTATSGNSLDFHTVWAKASYRFN
ncbi:outer membrane beta-barrel protein [Aureimonas altamirensis]|uniref:outer membrane protein n=1 Tax=Aureimonas altamirensis TaxID=370622 RepID=UPI001E54E34B|nr:outer membrane beta-barrel protein [Aureimonas altamirensis]UHD47168.1 outer membrane beta-barrel protein [Aureimonas altamirensis]